MPTHQHQEPPRRGVVVVPFAGEVGVSKQHQLQLIDRIANKGDLAMAQGALEVADEPEQLLVFTRSPFCEPRGQRLQDVQSDFLVPLGYLV